MNDLQLATIRNLNTICGMLSDDGELSGEALNEFRIESAKLANKIITLRRGNNITSDFYQAFCDAIPEAGRAVFLMSFVMTLKEISDDGI